MSVNCSDGVQWIWKAFGQCARNSRDISAISMGIISMVTMIAACLPQIIENFKSGLADKALSPFLLLFWTSGDICNLVGCILTKQLFLQTVLSIYGIANDCLLIAQYLFAKYRRNALHQALPSETDVLLDSQCNSLPQSWRQRYTTSLFCVISLFCLILPLTFEPYISLQMDPSGIMMLKRRLLSHSAKSMFPAIERQSLALPDITRYGDAAPFFPTKLAYIGYVIGWISGIFYISSRFPQIFRNWQRGSTAGLSLHLFCLMFISNLSYGLQIFLTSGNATFLLHALPWIIGSIGVMTLDFCIFLQFIFYKYSTRSFVSLNTDLESENNNENVF